MIRLVLEIENKEVEAVLRLLDSFRLSTSEKFSTLQGAEAWLEATDNRKYPAPHYRAEVNSVLEFVDNPAHV